MIQSGACVLVRSDTSARFVPRGERRPAALDTVRSAPLTAAVAALLYGIIEGPSSGWTSLQVLGARRFFATAMPFGFRLVAALVLAASVLVLSWWRRTESLSPR
ncbi:hypothetical protein AB0D54_28815 [Streptomyces xanthophaeus]|uniref:hypothetical protein n=1 Tax=Streptomyces xanthophaeus TaxID=67385 RepID=UPI00343563DF